MPAAIEAARRALNSKTMETKMMASDVATLTVREFAQKSFLSERTIRREIGAGRLQACRIGGKLRLDPSDIQLWLDAHGFLAAIGIWPAGSVGPILNDQDASALFFLDRHSGNAFSRRMRLRAPRLRERGVPIELVAGKDGQPRYRLSSTLPVRCEGFVYNLGPTKTMR
ncbi:helix-turn-helix domain-containing protein [Alsobacter sp. KACC 23698]|uniref:helix-turn-helix domain-containing protein n=1 Tax=Alsobacter sp. KACC 23698 TaxID=3149229 RepID=UPI0038780E0E